ncbi:hypothetical protein [Devosia sp. 2618]|uniref:hypothetical protein n=1 Tax=Devosia sp. 2618 TaxID=3156454 RepID=UPI003394FC52
MNRRIIVAAALCLALAQGATAGELDSFIAPVDGASITWSRNYDAAHLAAHPDQLVTAMQLAVSYEIFDPALEGQVNFELQAALRGGKQGVTTGTCMPYGQNMWCGVECDGGGILVSKRPGGSVLVNLANVGYIRMSEVGCGEDENSEGGSFDLTSGKDDKLFLLNRQ